VRSVDVDCVPVAVLLGAADTAGDAAGAVEVVVLVVAGSLCVVETLGLSLPRVTPEDRLRGPLSVVDDVDDAAVDGVGASTPSHQGRLVAGLCHPYGSMLIPWA